MKYDIRNCMLTLDDMSQCNQDFIKSWVDDNIVMILSDESVIERKYLTGKLDVYIHVVCYGFLVAIYSLSDDNLMIQSLGYEKALEQEREEETTDDQTEDNGSTPEAPEQKWEEEIIDDQHTKEYSLSITRDEIDSLRFALLHYRFYLENERRTSLILDESDYEEVTELSNIDCISDKLYKLLDPTFGSTDDDVLPF